MHRTFFILLPAACLAPALAAMTIDDGPVPGATLVTIEAHDDLVEAARDIEALLDDARPVVLAGATDLLARVRPASVMAWPATNTIVLEPGAGLGIHGFDAPDADTRLLALAAWPWAAETELPQRPARAISVGNDLRQVDFQMIVASPAQLCRKFSGGLAAALFQGRSPTSDDQRALRREVRRWCQYGNLSSHVAAPAQYTIEPFQGTDAVRLSLVAEWALVRSEDRADRTKTSYLFWTKTMGDGAGTGFTRHGASHGRFDRTTWEIRDIMDAAIHSGWGPIEPPGVVTAWPLNSTFPLTGNTHVFRCDAPPAFRPQSCPASPVLRRLLPADAFDGKITVSVGETLSVSGEAKLARSGDNDKKRSSAVSVAVQASRAMDRSSEVDVALARVRSSADTLFYRSTWWSPDLTGIYRWAIARDTTDDLSHATPLAATLNPQHEILWELPLAGNAGRELPYHVVYEAGLNTCNDSGACYGYEGPRTEKSKARVAWTDGIVVHLPWQ